MLERNQTALADETRRNPSGKKLNYPLTRSVS
jgi:hypothetical protein